MSEKRRKNSKAYFAVLVLLLAAGLVASAAVGIRFGNSDHMVSGGVTKASVDNTAANTAADQTEVQSGSIVQDPGSEIQTDDPPAIDPFAMTPKQIAATMQDYAVDPATGTAKEIKVVDDNYLLLVNRTHPLSADYAPDDLVKVSHVVGSINKPGETDHLRKVAAEAFDEMASAAEEAGIRIKMRTGYRSYEYQKKRLYDLYVKNYSQEYADTYSAKPGQSEHQTGLALDVAGDTDSYALSREFLSTDEGKWLTAHAYEYGFIFRYTDGTADTQGDITGYVSEPWHLRYVGIDAASEIHYAGQLLEEYLGVLN